MGERAEATFVAVVGVFGAPFVVMVLSQLSRAVSLDGDEARRALVAGLAYVPTLAGLAGLAVYSFRALRAQRRSLEVTCAAGPPVAPGAPARCRVCGGEIHTGAAGALVRCTYCQADNLLAPDRIAEQAVARARDADDQVAAISREAQALGRAGRNRAAYFVAAVPLFTCFCGCPNLFFAYRFGVATSELEACANRIVDTPAGPCVAERTPDGLQLRGAPIALPDRALPSPARGMPEVVDFESGRRGRARGYHGSARACGATLRVAWQDGETSSVPVSRLCFPDG